MAVVQQPIEYGGRNHFVVGEDTCPLAEDEVGGHDGGSALVAFGDYLEEVVGVLLTHRKVADFVDYQQDGAHHRLLDKLLIALLLLRIAELHQQVRRGGETHLVAMLHGPTGQRDRQVGLADAGLSRENDVLVPFDETEVGQFLDLPAVDADGEIVVELLKRKGVITMTMCKVDLLGPQTR